MLINSPKGLKSDGPQIVCFWPSFKISFLLMLCKSNSPEFFHIFSRKYEKVTMLFKPGCLLPYRKIRISSFEFWAFILNTWSLGEAGIFWNDNCSLDVDIQDLLVQLHCFGLRELGRLFSVWSVLSPPLPPSSLYTMSTWKATLSNIAFPPDTSLTYFSP